jgi:hypothetical protein
MEVESNSTVAELRRLSPHLTSYLKGHKVDGRDVSATAPILMSRRFYYFGESAISLPTRLRQALIIPAQGCWSVSRKDIDRLVAHLEMNYPVGKHGDPNQPTPKTPTKCGCSRGVSKP